MATLTIADVDGPIIERLRAQAERHQRSLEGEVRWILQTAVATPPTSWADALKAADVFRSRIAVREGSVVDDIHEARADRDARW